MRVIVAFVALVVGLGVFYVTRKPAAAPGAQVSAQAPRTFVLVHGAWGGGWAFRRVDSVLTANGQRVYRPTLTGLGERAHLASAEVGLGTHIMDVVNAILYEDLRDLVLVGHSYGGMVISGVAERIPSRVSRLVFIDAFVPEDGESLMTASRGTPVASFVDRVVKEARAGMMMPDWTVAPQDPPTASPQPVKTFTEPVTFRNAAARRIPGTYILTVEGPEKEDDFAPFAERARSRGWTQIVMRANHVPERSAPIELAQILLRPR